MASEKNSGFKFPFSITENNSSWKTSDGSAVPGTKFGSSVTENKPSQTASDRSGVAGFKFGSSITENNPLLTASCSSSVAGFKFGTSITENKPSTASNGSSVPGIKFGASVTENKPSLTTSDESGAGSKCGSSRTRQKDRNSSKSFISRETQTDTTSERLHLDSEDLSILRENFKNLLLTGDDHDVTLTVKEKPFKAHKCVLRARSPVFEAMFRNQMKESDDGIVSIDDCDPEVFGEFLRYVYTEKSDFRSASQAVGLYYAGDKYDLPRLKQKCVEFLKISLSITAISDVISMAARHDEKELLQRAIVYFSKHLQEIMLSVEWQRFLIANPIQANEMCLKAVQCFQASTTKKE